MIDLKKNILIIIASVLFVLPLVLLSICPSVVRAVSEGDSCPIYNLGGVDTASEAKKAEIAANDEDQGGDGEGEAEAAENNDNASTTQQEQAVGVGVTLPGAVTGGQSYTVSQYVWGVYSYSMKVAVALATLMVIFAGYKYLTSRGDSGAINEAKDILFSTLMGAALLMLVVLVAHVAGIEISIV